MTLVELLQLLKKYLVLIIVIPLVCTAGMAGYAYKFMPDQYTARVSLYVLAQLRTNTVQLDSNGQPIQQSGPTSSDFSAGQTLSNDVIPLLTSARVKADTATALGLDSLNAFTITATSTSGSRLVELTVEGTSPELTAQVANTLADTTNNVAYEAMDVQCVSVLSEAAVPTVPTGPDRLKYIGIAFAGGLFAAVALILVLDMLNTRIRSSKEVEELLGIPTIGHFPVIKE
ncbi:MAG: Wzz/FepE/Etk N-terminal domain-containing protein [Coriobacteriaceae bacterium]|nr:Wzz/FepE/Etk N-terminal domain-containing protein [Coriobacteriaceae bacterium]